MHEPLNRRVCLVRLAAVGASAGLLARAHAQGSWPDRPITVVLPVSSGSAGDVALRAVTQKMSENMKISFVLENQAGAAGIIGTEKVVRAKPDGYTLSGNGDAALNFAANLAQSLNFDPVNDLEPIALVARIPWVLVANPAFGPRTIGEFVARARAMPGRIDYGTAGVGSASHIGMEMLAQQAGIKLNNVPYKNVTPTVTDTVGGQVQAILAAVSLVRPFLRSGQLVALGMPAEKRSPFLPDVPTFAEGGLPGFTFDTWIAFFAPKGTPAPILERLRNEVDKAVVDPAVQERLLGLGIVGQTGSPEQVREMVRSGHARVAKAVREANIKAQ